MDNVDIMEFLKIIRTLKAQLSILEGSNIPDEQKIISVKALKTLVEAANKYMGAGV